MSKQRTAGAESPPIAERVRFALVEPGDVSEELLAQILALYARAFTRWPRLDPPVSRAEYLRWKMESPGAPFAAVVGRLGSRLVFARTVVRYDVRVHGARRVMIDLPDLAVEPEYQGQRISSVGSAWAEQRLPSDLQIEDSTHPRVAGRTLRTGSRPVANCVRPLHLVCDVRRWASEWRSIRRIPEAAAVLAARWLAAGWSLHARRSRAASPTGAIRTVTRFDARADCFFERAAAPFDLIFEAGRDYLNWRYCDRRAGPFVVRAFERAGELEGYAVARAAPPEGFVAELLALPGRLDVVEALARDVTGLLREKGAARIVCWLPARHPYRSVLRRLGFLSLGRHFPSRYRAERVRLEDLEFLERRSARLHYVIGNTDIV